MEQRLQRTSCMPSLRKNGAADFSSQTGQVRFRRLLVLLMGLPRKYIKNPATRHIGIFGANGLMSALIPAFSPRRRRNAPRVLAQFRDWIGAAAFVNLKTCQVTSSPWGEETGEGGQNTSRKRHRR